MRQIIADSSICGANWLVWACSGLRCRAAASIEGHALRVCFDHVSGGLVAKGGTLQGFEIAGDDRHFMSASARIAGERVVVACDCIGRADSPAVIAAHRLFSALGGGESAARRRARWQAPVPREAGR